MSITEKTDLIHTIMDAKKQLFGFGYTQHNEFTSLETKSALFDDLYDMDSRSLEILADKYSKQLTNAAQKATIVKL